MPQLGDIARAYDIQKGTSPNRHIWVACLDCGKERWVPFVNGKPKNLRCVHCSVMLHNQTYGKGKTHPAWKGGKYRDTNGYVHTKLFPDDFFFPMARENGYVSEHRLIMAQHLGRCLHRWELVHHKHTKYPAGSKEDKQDNRIENLQLVSDERHMQITVLENRIAQLEKENEKLRRQLKSDR